MNSAASVAVRMSFPQRLRGASLVLTQLAFIPGEGVTADEVPVRVRMASSLAPRSRVRQTPDLESVVADAIVEEFQPQLLTVVRDFLTALWNTTRQASERPEAAPATDEPQAAPWLPVISRGAPSLTMSFGSAPGDKDTRFSGSPIGPTLLPLVRAFGAASGFPGLARQGVSNLTGTPKHRGEMLILPPAPLAFGPSAQPRSLVRQPGLALKDSLTVPARREDFTADAPLAVRALPMTLPIAPLPPTPSEEHWRVQRAASGEPSAAPAGGEAHQQSVNLASQEKGSAANDVHLLANEVWSLLKRKLETESERLGRR